MRAKLEIKKLNVYIQSRGLLNGKNQSFFVPFFSPRRITLYRDLLLSEFVLYTSVDQSVYEYECKHLQE